jgi:hypothetical protein
MRVIGLAVILALSLFLAPLAAGAQPPGKAPRIGVLFPAEVPPWQCSQKDTVDNRLQ